MSQYVLKVVKPDMTTRGGFKWADVGGTTVAPDWSPMPTCGAGLHGWLSGIGDISCQSISDFEGAIWLALEVEGPVIALGGKVKFQSAKVLFAGRMTDAASEVARLSGESGPVIGIVRAGGDYSTVSGGSRATVSGGSRATVSGGNYSTVSGGGCSTVSGGDYSTVSGGDYSTVSGGDYSTVSGGSRATISGWDYSTVSGGDYSTVSGGSRATVSGGDYSTVSGGIGATVSGGIGATVSGGNYSTVSGGDYSTVSGGGCSTVSGGIGAALLLSYWDARTRIVVVYVGEGGVKPHTAYKLNSQHQFEEVV